MMVSSTLARNAVEDGDGVWTACVANGSAPIGEPCSDAGAGSPGVVAGALIATRGAID